MKKKSVKILAIETSCDETAVAIVENGARILANIISTQIPLHKKYGGVVPEIASRAHIESIIPVLEEAFKEAKLKWEDIDAVAVTGGPGLLGSLLIGVNTARTLVYLKKKPLIALNHLEGHIYANFIDKSQNMNEKFQIKNKERITDSQRLPKFPLLAMIVSGGHTNIVYMKDHLQYEVVGKTIDDAVGEAFDKVAKLLNLGYPGGPIISKIAEKGNSNYYKLPRTDLTPPPKRDDRGYLQKPKPSLNFSFSGLKTAVLTEIKKNPDILKNKKLQADLVSSFQQAVVDILIRNSANAIKMYKPKAFLLSGGVAANLELRRQLKDKIKEINPKIIFNVPLKNLCTDNAVMIGLVAYRHYKENDFTSFEKLSPDPNLSL